MKILVLGDRVALAHQYTNVVYQEKNFDDLLEEPWSGSEILTNASKTTQQKSIVSPGEHPLKTTDVKTAI